MKGIFCRWKKLDDTEKLKSSKNIKVYLVSSKSKLSPIKKLGGVVILTKHVKKGIHFFWKFHKLIFLMNKPRNNLCVDSRRIPLLKFRYVNSVTYLWKIGLYTFRIWRNQNGGANFVEEIIMQTLFQMWNKMKFKTLTCDSMVHPFLTERRI